MKKMTLTPLSTQVGDFCSLPTLDITFSQASPQVKSRPSASAPLFEAKTFDAGMIRYKCWVTELY